MAELLLKVGDGSNYEDGDVLCAFNRRRILSVHAQHVCHPRVNGRKVGGRLSNGQPLLESLLRRTYQYRFERVSATELKRVDQWAATEEILSDRPNAKGECIHLEEYFERRLQSGKLPLFGTAGREVWYGGNSDWSLPNVEKIWDDIETATPLRRADYDLWPAGEQELRSHLLVPVVEFSDAEAQVMESSWTEPEPTVDDPDAMRTVKKRVVRGNWRAQAVLDRLGVTVADVEDRGMAIDRRRGVEPLGDVLLLWHKQANRPARRIV